MNRPFFLSKSSLFVNYEWRPSVYGVIGLYSDTDRYWGVTCALVTPFNIEESGMTGAPKRGLSPSSLSSSYLHLRRFYW
jgi:hypothetical protein